MRTWRRSSVFRQGGACIASVPNLYLDYPQIDKKGVARAAVETEAARFLLDQPGVANVYTRSQFESGAG